MKTAFILGALLAALASRQEPAEETAADLDKRAKESLRKEIAVAKGLNLPLLFFMFDSNHKVNLQCYVDPVAVPKVDKVEISFEGVATLDEVLEKSLKPKALLHHVWQGIVVITNEKGLKAFQDTDWTGLTQKALRDHPELSKKLERAYAFDWDATEHQEALKSFAKISGVAINTDALKGLLVKEENSGMLSPDRTTLWGALVCLARNTGITYEITKDGGLVSKKPAKK